MRDSGKLDVSVNPNPQKTCQETVIRGPMGASGIIKRSVGDPGGRSSSDSLKSLSQLGVKVILSTYTMATHNLEESISRDVKTAEITHVDTTQDAALKEKGEMAAGHEELEKTLTLWQNLKLYRKVCRCMRPS